ncbi:hypothetical protein BH23BAC3_BH23BAC3_31650 [soil metagenome]
MFLLFWTPVEKHGSIDGGRECGPALTPAPLEEEWAVEWWIPRHEEKLQKEVRETARLLFLGDSITHGWETTGNEVFKQYYADYNTYNIGFSGDRTENVLWRLQNGEIDGINPEAAVLMIGTNNTGHRQDPSECTSEGILKILDELHDKLPETHVLLLAIFPRDEFPDDELRVLNREINQKIEMYGEREQVTFLDINHLFLDDDGVLSEEIMPDLLHPNERGYQIWAEGMNSTIQGLLN